MASCIQSFGNARNRVHDDNDGSQPNRLLSLIPSTSGSGVVPYSFPLLKGVTIVLHANKLVVAARCGRGREAHQNVLPPRVRAREPRPVLKLQK